MYSSDLCSSPLGAKGRRYSGDPCLGHVNRARVCRVRPTLGTRHGTQRTCHPPPPTSSRRMELSCIVHRMANTLQPYRQQFDAVGTQLCKKKGFAAWDIRVSYLPDEKKPDGVGIQLAK